MVREGEATFTSLDNLPSAQTGRPGTKWTVWLDRIKGTAEVLCLSPVDSHQAHVMRNTAHNIARRKRILINTRVVTEDSQLKLYIWCP